MTRWRKAALLIILVPLYLIAFTVVHEMGHTVLARLFGDPDSTFYLVRIGPGGRGLCLGCNITDHTKLSPRGNFAVALGGLLFTQITAVVALLLLPRLPPRSRGRQMLTAIVLGYAFLDVTVQVVQGLLYDLAGQTWPTNVDLVDAMLLISQPLDWPQWLLKALMALIAVAYLVVIWRTYKRRSSSSASHLTTETSPATS